MSLIDWRSELSRGALPYGTLAALSARPRHGYELVTRLRAASFPRLQGGTLYPLLRRLEDQRLISHAWDTSAAGPARKVFTLTELGAAELHYARVAWAEVSRGLESLLDPTGEVTR